MKKTAIYVEMVSNTKLELLKIQMTLIYTSLKHQYVYWINLF